MSKGKALTPAADGLLERLERHRDHHFRRLPPRRIKDERAALAFINETGFCSAFTAGLGVPCLREAIEGRREPPLPEHIQHDPAIMMTWRLKDSLPARRQVYYGKVIGGRPGFIALDLLPAFLRLRVASGTYLAHYRRGTLSHCAKLVMDQLTRRGPTETMALKLSSGYSEPKRRAEFDRAMKELQEKFLALKVEERYDPFTYVWDTVAHQWSEALGEARSLTPPAAAEILVRRYFTLAGYGSDRLVARLLGVDLQLAERAAQRLERTGLIRRGQRVAGVRETVSVLAEYLG
ncbi:MAG TPA: hypothetical protein VMF50_01955 [Candidatus Binataceae bacterium]|nr:hypothetical protein [Candidatus Binataceae bacterium]